MKLRHTQAVWLMVAVTLMWSMAGVVTRQLQQAHGFEVTFWRSCFTVLSLLVILPLWQGAGVFGRLHWRSPSWWISGLCWSIMFTAFMLAMTLTSVANVLIALAVGPLLTAIAARVLIGHRIARRTALAILVAGLGIAWMYGAQLLAQGSGRLLLGSLVALGAPMAAAVNWTVVQRSQTRGESIDLVPSVLLGALLSCAMTLPLAFPMVASGRDLAWLALLGTVQLAIPCVLSVLCARVLQAPELSLLGLLEVIFGIIWAWLWANETPGPEVLLGGGLVLAALVGNEWLGWRERVARSEVRSGRSHL